MDQLERLKLLEEKNLKTAECLRKSKARPEYKEVIKRGSAIYYQRHKQEISIRNRENYLKKKELLKEKKEKEII